MSSFDLSFFIAYYNSPVAFRDMCGVQGDRFGFVVFLFNSPVYGNNKADDPSYNLAASIF